MISHQSNARVAVPGRRRVRSRRPAGQRGVAAILAMMFLVIFSALAAAMAIVAEGNLAVADSDLRVNKALAATETGLTFITYRINAITPTITTRSGLITSSTASTLWTTFSTALLNSLLADTGNNVTVNAPHWSGTSLIIGPIPTGPSAPTFTITLTPHAGTSAASLDPGGVAYNSSYYQRAPYNGTDAATAYLFPQPFTYLDATWVRCRIDATDGTTNNPIKRSIQVDFKMTKQINYAILSKSRVMIGRNVMIKGNIGSSFGETNLVNGHPIQMASDFSGLDPTLDANLAAFHAILATNDKNGDNRINLNDPAEMAGLPSNFAQNDKNGDGYVDEYDYFLAKFDTNGDGKVSATELDTANHPDRAQLLSLIDNFYGNTGNHTPDSAIGTDDMYAKIQGSVFITASLASWQAGAASTANGGPYQNFFAGPIVPNYGQSPVTFQSNDPSLYTFAPSDFSISSYSALATGVLSTQVASNLAATGTTATKDVSGSYIEAVPYGSANPYDYYRRPVYTNMTFTNVTIPSGTNALFNNCTFVGVTYVATNADTSDPSYNYVGMTSSDATTLTHADRSVTPTGYSSPVTGTYTNSNDPLTIKNVGTKEISNNVRFNGCTFKGSIVSAVPSNFAQARNKIAFTGNTSFSDVNNPTVVSADSQLSALPASEIALMARSPLLVPQYSVELGTLNNGSDPTQSVTMNGTLVAGIIDIRGQVTINGTILTTYLPQSNVAPVVGNESPDYNSTLGYFASTGGDKEEGTINSATGMGMIQIKYDPTRPLPDGILSAIQLTAIKATYFEGGSP